METHDQNSPEFLSHVESLSREWDMPCETEQERKLIFEELVSMKSWGQKGRQPKAANWFAWNLCADADLREWEGSNVVFEASLPPTCSPDNEPFELQTQYDNEVRLRANLKAMLNQGGGLKLQWQLMKQNLLQHVRIITVVERPSWCFYTEQIKEVLTPRDAAACSIAMADGAGSKASTSGRRSPQVYSMLTI